MIFAARAELAGALRHFSALLRARGVAPLTAVIGQRRDDGTIWLHVVFAAPALRDAARAVLEGARCSDFEGPPHHQRPDLWHCLNCRLPPLPSGAGRPTPATGAAGSGSASPRRPESEEVEPWVSEIKVPNV